MIGQGGGASAGAQGGRRGLSAGASRRRRVTDMPVFTWEGRTRQGTIKKGVMEAVNEAAVMAQLRAQALHADRREGEGARTCSEHLTFLQAGRQDQGPRDLHPAVRDDDRRRPAAGAVPRHPGGPAAEQDASRRSSREVKADVEQGSTFADALRKHPKLFDDLYVNLVAAGEVGGILDTILNRLAVYLEKADDAAAQGEGRDGLPGHRRSWSRSASWSCCWSRSSRSSRRCSRTSAASCPAPDADGHRTSATSCSTGSC